MNEPSLVDNIDSKESASERRQQVKNDTLETIRTNLWGSFDSDMEFAITHLENEYGLDFQTFLLENMHSDGVYEFFGMRRSTYKRIAIDALLKACNVESDVTNEITHQDQLAEEQLQLQGV